VLDDVNKQPELAPGLLFDTFLALDRTGLALLQLIREQMVSLEPAVSATFEMRLREIRAEITILQSRVQVMLVAHHRDAEAVRIQMERRIGERRAVDRDRDRDHRRPLLPDVGND
jgi:hypothetical protein